ncbi:MAG: cell division protein FtsL [Dokdonella sp.]|uniref:cell division protein FtsL n=1 Tax=Dokdonella sp. TaxID=2291710 RepID=UPI0025C623B5|nr:cell division protein FtsL [Dokdonella sp.]MBX3701740.1 cell division protein FtsL [Dokdonella sp.]
MKLAAALALFLLLVAVLASASAVVYVRQQNRVDFAQLTRLGTERDDLNFEYGRLQLEQATWADNNRIDQIAREKLGMVAPTAASTVVIRR